MKEKSQDRSECLKRAAEARRLAREEGDPAEKADLFSVEDDGACWASRRKKKWSHDSANPLAV
jgi:hypothetical protein